MTTHNSYLHLLDENLLQNIYKKLFNDVLCEQVPRLIEVRKGQIFRSIWSDPYLHAIISDGLIKEIMIDKDTYDFDDQQYFIIVNTTIPRETEASRLKTAFLQLVLIVQRSGSGGYTPFKLNDKPIFDADPDNETYSFSMPIVC